MNPQSLGKSQTYSLEEAMEQKPKEGDREFTGRGMASIFGAPISWIALFGALMGALSIVPMIFYPFGGGFASAGMLVFGPLAGLILGPWAGAIAGLIGGLIGILVGVGGSWLFGKLGTMQTVILPSSIFLAFFSAAAVGAFFGFYPANQAAQLDPIDALRHE